ncbi:Rad4-domain-containing protein [Tothia fuscella]|uniref:Rad4-domain-containing protein n=1 Tax=Tothia fuscella TaxID=1048955 RepID=A0A9P4NJE7_9PEZI|nr:Rad4-domain-containing protein [Tothia fuscella]
MAPWGGRSRGRGKSGSQTGRGRSSKKDREIDDGVPEIFKEMLSEEGGPSADEDRPLKRRRVGERIKPTPKQATQQDDGSILSTNRMLQTITDESESSESEIDWEDIALEKDDLSSLVDIYKDKIEEPLNIVIDLKETPLKRSRTARKPISSAEKAMRFDVHRMHVTYLIYHGFFRNRWCNDRKTQIVLKRLVTPKLITMLNPNPNASQSQRASLFTEGLKQICDLWYIKFSITALGMKRPKWIADKSDVGKFKLPVRTEKPMEKSDFRRAAQTLDGSADLSAQLFCCLLRAVGTEARLVFSLQPLGFNAAADAPAPPTPVSGKKTVYAASTDEEADTSPKAESSNTSRNNITARASTLTITPQRIKRFGQTQAGPATPDLGKPPPTLLPNRLRKVQRPSHPVFWVEAFNPAHQKWVAVDAIATKTVGRPSRLEPALNDQKNCLTYALAFDEDGHARDVTYRYTKSFNAKTRKLRVESMPGGDTWFRKAMKLFKRYALLDRDQLENAELTAKEASEGMPRNVQDFKNHPYYALERHLKHNEIIHPKQEAGRVNIGTSAVTRFETVYRRKDVHIVRSADKWFRLGRDIKPGEQPLKHAQPRRVPGREPSVDPDVKDVGIGQYALFQTELYIPPRVVNGRIPKNAFGNLDVYVPSMIPPGAVHIPSTEAKNAARLLNVDYADAVTGFQFKGRHGTAVIQGIIVAAEYEVAIRAVVEGFTYMKEEALEEQRSREALRMWRRFLVGLRVVERMKIYRDAGEVAEEERVEGEELRKEIEKEFGELDLERGGDSGGGFLVDQDDDGEVVPTAQLRSRRNESMNDTEEEGDVDGDGGFLPDAEEEDDRYEDGGFLPDADDVDDEDAEDDTAVIVSPSKLRKEKSLFGLENFDLPEMAQHVTDEEDGGGFRPESDHIGGGGGFILEEKGEDPNSMEDEALRKSLPPAKIDVHDFASTAVPERAQEGPQPVPSEGTNRISKSSDKALELDVSSRLQTPHNPTQSLEDSSTKVADSFMDQSKIRTPKDGVISKGNDLRTRHQSLRPNHPSISASPVESAAEELSDQNSVLLEDPEDEDAEPEWLL